MKKLHITQGGIDNDDKDWLERAARNNLVASEWTVPKAVSIGDEIVVYVTTFGFFATARVASTARKRKHWPNRYGAKLDSIKLIEPAISLGTIQRRIPELNWANYPRSITTPSDPVAARIRSLISNRRRMGVADIDDEAIDEANLHELRALALLKAKSKTPEKERTRIERIRSQAIHRYVVHRASGYCEGCETAAPFRKPNGTPFLEPHHTTRVADDGPDHPEQVIALCPNCHRRAHYSDDAAIFNRRLIRLAARIERHL